MNRKLDSRFSIYADASGLDRATSAQQEGTSSAPAPGASGPRSFARGLSVVVLNLDRPDLIIPLVTQLREEREAFARNDAILDVLVGDTGSTSSDVLSAYDAWGDDVVVRHGLSYHFSRCNNLVARQASSDLLLFLNNDVILPPRPGVLYELCRKLREMPDVGVLGAVLCFPDGTLQHCGISFLREPPRRAFPFHAHAREAVRYEDLPDLFDAPAATGSFLLVRRELFEALSGFSEDYEIEAQDVDLCLRAHRLGYRARIANLGNVVHLENATRPKGEEHWPDRRLFLRRWRSYVEAHFM